MPHYRIVGSRHWIKNEISSLRLISQVVIGDEKLVSLTFTHKDITSSSISLNKVKVKNNKDLALNLKEKLGYDNLTQYDEGTEYDTIEGDKVPTEKCLLLRKILFMCFSDMLIHDDKEIRENTESICKELAKVVKMDRREKEKKFLIRLMELESRTYKDEELKEQENIDDELERQLFRALACYTAVLSMCGYSDEDLTIKLQDNLSDEMAVFYAAFRKYREFVMKKDEESSQEDDTFVDADEDENGGKEEKKLSSEKTISIVEEKKKVSSEKPKLDVLVQEKKPEQPIMEYSMNFSLSTVLLDSVEKDIVMDVPDTVKGALILAIGRYLTQQKLRDCFSSIDLTSRDGLAELLIKGNATLDEQMVIVETLKHFSDNPISTEMGYLYVEERMT